MRSPQRGNSSSYTKGILLLVILVVSILIYQRINQHGFSSQISNVINNEFTTYRDFKEFSEEKKTALKKEFAGFWVYETADSNAPIQKWDHIELRDNGIIWQVAYWFLELPSGDTASFLYTCTAYLSPFGKVPGMMERYGCDVRILRQTFVVGNDTCYGASQVDQMWKVEKLGEDLIVDRKRYFPYNGDIQEFFPPGAIDLVDKLIVNECKRDASLPSLTKDALKQTLAQSSPISFNINGIREWVEHYYKPSVLDEIVESFSPVSPVPDSIRIEFQLSAEGHVINSKLKSLNASNGNFNRLFLAEINTWVFPKIKASKPGQISYTFFFHDN